MPVPIPQLVQSFLKMMRKRKTSVVVLYGAVDANGRPHVKMTLNVGAPMALALVQQTARNTTPQLEDEKIEDAELVEPEAPAALAQQRLAKLTEGMPTAPAPDVEPPPEFYRRLAESDDDDVTEPKRSAPSAGIPRGSHVWRQVGMTGSEHDECVLCGATTAGLGQAAAAAAGQPCDSIIEFDERWGGRWVRRYRPAATTRAEAS